MKDDIAKMDYAVCRTLKAALGAFALLAGTWITQEADAPPAPSKGWDTTMTLGATLTRGNSKTFLGTALINTKRTWTNNEVLFGGSAGYGETTVNFRRQEG
jgi:hypothetical protein